MHYIVNLRLILGEYEKSSMHVVDANTATEASQLALANECNQNCHMEPDGESCWDGSDFVYRVKSCQPIPADFARLLCSLRDGKPYPANDDKEVRA